MAARAAKLAAEEERKRREEEKRAFKEAQELDALRRTFKRIIKSGDNKISADDIITELKFLGFAVTEKEAALFVWEVDDDNDGHVDWEEVRALSSPPLLSPRHHHCRPESSCCRVLTHTLTHSTPHIALLTH